MESYQRTKLIVMATMWIIWGIGFTLVSIFAPDVSKQFLDSGWVLLMVTVLIGLFM